jgi:hypothetical protein
MSRLTANMRIKMKCNRVIWPTLDTQCIFACTLSPHQVCAPPSPFSEAQTPLVRFVVNLLWICFTTSCTTCRKVVDLLWICCTICCTANPQQIEQVEFELESVSCRHQTAGQKHHNFNFTFSFRCDDASEYLKLEISTKIISCSLAIRNGTN